MKRGVALAFLILATSVVASAQFHGVPPSVTSLGPGRGPTPGVPPSVTSMGPVGYGFFSNRVSDDLYFGRHPNFINDNRHHHHHHYFPVVVPYYTPYYGWTYPLSDDYDPSAYQQQVSTQPAQPVVAVDPKPTDDRYGEHSFNEQPQQSRIQPSSAPQEQEPTVLVFRDGHKQEIKNYAIIGQMLWDFSAKGTHKIPLSDLDLDATRKLNDDRGVEFVLPKS